MPEVQSLILASGSAARRQMLAAAGLVFEIAPAHVDEDALRDSLAATDPTAGPVEVARALAVAKALAVSNLRPDAWVIGSDQVLDIDGVMLTKPETDTGVRETLQTLRGRTHALHSAVTLARDGEAVWSACQTAGLTMRPLSDAFIAHYIASADSGIHGCVGAYQIEGLGIQLFDRIEGDHFTILGLPLLPLLAALRERGVIAA